MHSCHTLCNLITFIYGKVHSLQCHNGLHHLNWYHMTIVCYIVNCGVTFCRNRLNFVSATLCEHYALRCKNVLNYILVSGWVDYTDITCATPLMSQASEHILDKDQEYGKTRSQTRKLSESSDDSKKPAVKRTSTMAQTAKVGRLYVLVLQTFAVP